MDLLRAAILGLVQGVTEFVPISSSAHLVLTSRVLGWPDQGLAFDMATHAGSLVAVFVYFRADIGRLTRGTVACLRDPRNPAGREALTLVIATVPIAVAGLLLQDWVGTVGRSPALIAGTLIGFGLLLGVADLRGRRPSRELPLGLGAALLVGLAQALALVPGTSRAGVTITAGLFLGLSRRDAARFSFLLAVPAGLLVAGKTLLDVTAGGAAHPGWASLAVGFVVAAVTAHAAISLLLRWLERRSLRVFVVYRVLLGIAILLTLANLGGGGA